MRIASYKAKNSQDGVRKFVKYVFVLIFSVLLISAALFGGAALGNKDIADTVLETSAAQDIQAAEAGSDSGGKNAVVRSFASLGTFTISNTFNTNNVAWTSYYSGNSHGNQNWLGAGYFGNGGKGTVRQGTTISSASTNFSFTAGSVAGNLQQKNLLRIRIYATVRSKNSYVGTRSVGYRLGSSNMQVTTSSTLLPQYTIFATRDTSGNNETRAGNTGYINLTSTQSVISLAVGGRCVYTSWIGGRYPGQQAESIKFEITSRDIENPKFKYPSINKTDWKANTRDVEYTVTDNGALSAVTVSGGSGTSPAINKSLFDSWLVTFNADYRYTYTVKATDTTGNIATSSSRNYINFKLDGYAPKILRVVFVRAGNTSVLVGNGLSPGTGAPWSGSVRCFIEVEDYQSNSNYSSGTINSSGIGSVTFDGRACEPVPNNTVYLPIGTNGAAAYAKAVNTADGAIGKSWYEYKTNINDNFTSKTIRVTDNVGKSATKTVSLYHIDRIAPVVEKAEVTRADGTALPNGSTWFNAPATLTLTVVDYATTGNISNTRTYAAGIQNINLKTKRFSRNAAGTGPGAQTDINISFNPTTSTATSGVFNGDNSAFMQRTIYTSGTYTTGGVTYYCYRYIIKVPILYQADYKFTITDKAGNARTSFRYTHLSTDTDIYKPNLDETAPSFSGVILRAYNAQEENLGDPGVLYRNASYLQFIVSANDQSYGGKNDGSGIKTIQIYDGTTLVSQWTTGTPLHSVSQSLYVYDDSYTGNKDSTSVRTRDINSCTTPTYKIKIIDAAGNATDMTPSSATGSMQINNNSQASLNAHVLVDNIAPTLSVYYQGGSSLITPTTTTYGDDDTARIYEYDWTATSQTIHIKYSFGCSGATLYQYNNSLKDSDRVSIANWAAGGSQNRNNNAETINRTYSTEGISHYSFKAISGAQAMTWGKGSSDDSSGVDYTIIVIRVKVDKTAPSYELLGFGTGIASAGQPSVQAIKNSIENIKGPALNEDLLTQTNSYYGTDFRAYYYIKDTYSSTIDNREETSWLDGGLAKAHVKVKHGNYEHNYTVGYDLLSNPNFTILSVPMYNLTDLRLMKHKSTQAPIYDSTYNLYHLTYGENVVYNIAIKDAVGNARDIRLKEQSKELSYNVDPFPLSSTQIGIPVDTTYNYAYYGEYVGAGDNGWTNDSIKYTVTKQTSISPVVVQYKLVPIIANANTSVPTRAENPGAIEYIEVGDLGSASTATFILSPQDGSRCAFIEFRIYKSWVKHGESENNSFTKANYTDIAGKTKEYIIKQDVDVPVLTALYFSRSAHAGVVSEEDALANSSIVAYFAATQDQDGSYTYTRKTSEVTVWTYEQLYMYVIVSDSLEGSGAGVQTVYLYNQNEFKSSAVYQSEANTTGKENSGEQVFRSATASFGYNDATSKSPIYFELIDYVPEPGPNTTSKIEITVDSKEREVLPSIDDVMPKISVTSASHAGGSYLENGKLSGDAIRQSLTINIGYSWGASGATIYRVDIKDYFAASYDNDPWSFGKTFAGTTVNTEHSPTSLAGLLSSLSLQDIVQSGKEIQTLGASPGSSTFADYLSNNMETMSRYYYFIVSNINEYQDFRPIGYVAAGDIFIDNKEPVIHYNHSYYTSKTSGNPMDIASTYTNDAVLAYMFVSDGASGVSAAYLKNGTIANTKAAYEQSGTKLAYVGTDARGDQYKFDAMTSNIAYQFIVFDNAGNYTESTPVTPRIDNTVPKIVISARKADGSAHRIDIANNFTNSPYLTITLTVQLGLSRLGALTYNIDGSEHYLPITSLRDKDGKALTLTQQGNNTQVIFNINKNHRYKFKATNNVLAEYSKDGTVPSAQGEMYVAIDVTAPSLNENNDQYKQIKTGWHNTPQSLILDAKDETGGSGIDFIQVYYTVGGRSYDQFFKYNDASGKFETYTQQGDNIVFGGDFALSEFVTYNIEITDKAKNKSQTYKIRPNLDQLTPKFNASYVSTTVDGSVYNGGSMSAPNWTKHNVNIALSPSYTMSGAWVEVAIKNNVAGADWGNWINIKDFAWGNDPVLDADAGTFDSTGNDFTYLIKPDDGKKSVNAYYKFRIISNAGLQYEDEKIILVQIDQAIPEFSTQTKVSYINSSTIATTIPLSEFVSTADAFSFIFSTDEWTSRNVSITPSIATNPASGSTLEVALFNVNTNKWNDWSICQSNPFEHSSDTAGISYKFRYVSGSKIPSKELIVQDIKVDKKAPTLAIQTRISFEGVTNPDGSFATAPKSVFDHSQPYNTTWTNARYVVIRVSAEFGFSGIDISFLKDGTKIDQNDISIAYEQSGELYYYVPYTVNLRVDAKSRAGLTGLVNREIRIDNLLPELYVSEITGTKSTHWDETVDNSWFTSNVYFQFGVGSYKNQTGTLERNLTADNKAITPPSGYRIEYRVKTANGYTEWSDTNSTSSYGITTMDVVEGRIYNFRIVSGSGMVHELGKDIIYNNQVIASSEHIYENIRANHPDALFEHLVQDRYDYLINLDQNIYYMSVSQNIKFFDGANVQDSFSNDYAKYSYDIFVGGKWIPKQDHDRGNDYEYYHGDLIKLTYQANYDLGKYLHRYTDYLEYVDTVKDGVTTRNTISSRTFTSGLNEEKVGAIEFRFTKYNYAIESYFKQELVAEHTDKVAYVQSYRQTSNPTFASKVDVKYYYKVGGDTVSISLGASLDYKNMQTNLVQQGHINIQGNDSLGGYLITAMLDHEVNRQSFIIKNPNDIMLVKYFTVNGNNPYKINDQNDLEMISSYYIDSYNLETLTLDAQVPYLSHDFIQTADIALSPDFALIGEFSGSYDGDGKTITFASVTQADGVFGLFTSIKGSVDDLAQVSNLAINVPHLIVTNAQNIGILAGSITDARINNIWINANLTIDSASASANIGGLTGSTSNAQIGGYASNFIDVRMYHNGNALGNFIAQGAAIGGVIGDAKQNTYLFNTYNFGSMEIYGVTSDIDSGAVIGKLAAYVTEGNVNNFFTNNSYLRDNAFINGGSVDRFIGKDNSAKSVVNASALYYSDFVQLTNAIVGRTIKDSILQRLYADFGMEVRVQDSHYVYAEGIGTADDMLMISTVTQLETIDEYVMLHYRLTGDIDMTGFSQSIAANKVFTGVLDGKNGEDAMLTNFTGDIYQGYYGLFANLNGTVKNIVFDDLKIDIEYMGNDDLYMGLVAAKSYDNADINNIIAIGIIKIDAPNAKVVAGGLVGQAQFGYIYNVFNMANTKVSAKELSLGGIIGQAAGTILVNYQDISDAIFSLARVEGVHTGFGDVGAIVGSGSILEVISDMSKVFALADNTYSNGSLNNRTIGSSTVNSAVLTTFGNTAMRSVAVSDGNLFNEVFVTRNLYPLQGISENLSSTVGADLDNPFKISTEEDFKYINNALYANYRIVAPNNRITFASFETIGEGLFFTGRIDGKTAESGSAEEGEVVSLDGVTDALVYYNLGSISDFSINVNYTRTLSNSQNADFGTVAKYNKGTIRNVIVAGNIVINGGNSVTASGFVGIDYGGTIDNSSIKNSISSVSITVNRANTIYIGGYIGKVTGTTTVSFAIGQGNINIIDCPSYYVGWLIGSVEGTLDIDLSIIQNYAYTINITEDDIAQPPIISTLENYTGLRKM